MSVKPYGAFVDIGNGVSGLLHISQISHDRISNVDKVLSDGDRIKVRALACACCAGTCFLLRGSVGRCLALWQRCAQRGRRRRPRLRKEGQVA